MRLSVHVHCPPYTHSRPGWHTASTHVLKLSKGGRLKHAQCFHMAQAKCQCSPGTQVETVWGSTAQSVSWRTKLSFPGPWSVCSELRLAGPIVWTELASCVFCTISWSLHNLLWWFWPPAMLFSPVWACLGNCWVDTEIGCFQGEQTSWKELIETVSCVPPAVLHIDPCCAWFCRVV